MATTSTDPQFPPGLNNFIERIDSDRTDESPFGSALTTPVDENVILFSTIEQRLVTNPLIAQEYSEERYELRKDVGNIDSQTLKKTIVQDVAKLMIDDKIRATSTPSPTEQFADIPARSNIPLETDMNQIDIRANRPIDNPFELNDTSPFDKSENPSSAFDSTGEMKPLKDQMTIEELPDKQTSEPCEETAHITRELFSLLPFAHQSSLLDEIAHSDDIVSSLSQLSLQLLSSITLRVLLFLPWTVIAGANILLFPKHLETVFFGFGYLTAPQGMHRFALWADISKELVSIFLAFLLVLWCIYPTVGLLAMGAMVAQFVYAWQGFQVDRRIPLGQDDQQSLYHVFQQYLFGDALENLREDDKGLYVTDDESDYRGMVD